MSLGPAALVRSVPGALDRTPADELVLVGVSELSAGAAAIFTVDLFDTDSEEAVEETVLTIHQAIGVLVNLDRATKVAVLVYSDDAASPDSTPARFGATAVVAAEAAGLGVLDAVAVFRGRWRSYDCTNPSCCPPDGTPIIGDPTP